MPRAASYLKTRTRQADQLFDLLSAGKTDDEIRQEMELSEDAFAGLRERMVQQIGERLKQRSPEQVYLEYLIHNRSCMAMLDDAIGRFRLDRSAHNAIVGAIRARSELFDKTIKFGQELGLIKKMPEEKRIIAGVLVTQLSDEELRNAIASQVASMERMVRGLGQGSGGDQKIIDMPADDLHYDLPEPVRISGPNKTNRAKANRNYGGRRVVKEVVDP